LLNPKFHIHIHRSPSLVLFHEPIFSTHIFPTIYSRLFCYYPNNYLYVSKRSLYLRETWRFQCQIFCLFFFALIFPLYLSMPQVLYYVSRWRVVDPRINTEAGPTLKLEDHPLFSVCDWLFNALSLSIYKALVLQPQSVILPCHGGSWRTQHTDS
jgi:hypothetical protein